MTQGSKETLNYYTIKIGDVYLKEFKKGGLYGSADVQPYLMDMSLSIHENKAYKWHFDSLAEIGEEGDVYREKDFTETLKILENNGIAYKVLKTTVVTLEGQKEVTFVDGKEEQISVEALEFAATIAKEGGEFIGNTLKTILTRISDVPSVKESLEKYGFNTEGSAEMTLKDLASKWNDLDDEQKRLVGVDVAGVYKLAGFITALSELNKYKE